MDPLVFALLVAWMWTRYISGDAARALTGRRRDRSSRWDPQRARPGVGGYFADLRDDAIAAATDRRRRRWESKRRKDGDDDGGDDYGNYGDYDYDDHGGYGDDNASRDSTSWAVCLTCLDTGRTMTVVPGGRIRWDPCPDCSAGETYAAGQADGATIHATAERVYPEGTPGPHQPLQLTEPHRRLPHAPPVHVDSERVDTPTPGPALGPESTTHENATPEGTTMTSPARTTGTTGSSVAFAEGDLDPRQAHHIAMGLANLASSLMSKLEGFGAELTTKKVTGQPHAHIAQAAEHLTGITTEMTALAAIFRTHMGVQEHVESTPTVGGDAYLRGNLARK